MKKISLFCPVVFLFFSCSSTKLVEGAEKVRIMQTEPKGCTYLGEVTGNQGNSFTGGLTSNSNLETGARNDMKNKAFEMHGNVIVMLTNRAGVTGSVSGGSGGSEQTNVTYTGTVFNCPAEIVK